MESVQYASSVSQTFPFLELWRLEDMAKWGRCRRRKLATIFDDDDIFVTDGLHPGHRKTLTGPPFDLVVVFRRRTRSKLDAPLRQHGAPHAWSRTRAHAR